MRVVTTNCDSRVPLSTQLAMWWMYDNNSPKALEMYESMKSAVARANLSLQNIGDLEILLPPLDDQRCFSVFLKQTDKSKFVAYQETIFIEKILKYTYNHNFRRKNNVH